MSVKFKPSINKIRYADATLTQLTKVQLKTKTHDFALGKTVKDLVTAAKNQDRLEPYKSYDRYGRPTLVGKAKRLQDLKDRNLPETATLTDFLTKFLEDFANSMAKKFKQIEKRHNKISYRKS